ncbi:MAG: type II secretion system protein GspC [Myxococcota bacterium]|nr:type II secretion system protein GspC [Myxococcota bacterium]
MSKSKWVLTGIYAGAILLGWSLAFGGSKYVSRILSVEDSFENPVEVASQTKKPKKRYTKPQKSKYVNAIKNRNIFDSTQVNKVAAETPPEEGDATISDIDVQLIGTIVLKPAEQSLAWIRINSTNKTTAYGVGDALLDATIERIESENVWLRRNNTSELLTMYGDKKGSGSKSTPSKRKDKKDDDSGISKNGKDRYVVDQAVFDELLSNPEKLYTQIRATEHKTDGEVDGYRVSGIRRKSIFYKLGVKNGDIIHGVNGMPLTNLNNAMEAYQSLQSSRDFSFDITRRKKKRKMEYEVR